MKITAFGIEATNLSKIGLVAILMCSLVLGGCSVATVITDIQRFLPAVTNVLTAVCAFTSNPLCATGTALAKTSADAAIVALQKYLDDAKAGTATAAGWNYANAAFVSFADQAAAIFNLANVSDPQAQKEILALVASAQVLLAVIETQFPNPPAGAQASRPVRFSAHLPATSVGYDGRWLRSWEKDYNSKVDAAQTVKSHVKLKHVRASLLSRIGL